MSKINWDSTGSRFYETGVDHGVLYVNGFAVPWNGITSITETYKSTEGISFLDGYRYMNTISLNQFNATLNAFTYPEEFEECLGRVNDLMLSKPKQFNLSYRTKIANDISGVDLGYKIHLIYNAIALEAKNDFVSYGSQITPTEFSWNIATLPVETPLSPTSHIILDSTKINPTVFSQIEELLYGTDYTDPYFPSVTELIDIFDTNSYFRIYDHGDGSFTAVGDDDHVKEIEPTVFELSSVSVINTSDDSYTASSY